MGWEDGVGYGLAREQRRSLHFHVFSGPAQQGKVRLELRSCQRQWRYR